MIPTRLLIAQQQEVGVASFLTPCSLLPVRSDTSEEREEQPLPQFRTLATSKKFIQLQQSNMETFPHTFTELWCYLPCFVLNSHWGAQSPCTWIERYTVIPPGCSMDACAISWWQVWPTPHRSAIVRYMHDCALTSIIILSHFLKGKILSVIVNCWAVEPDLQP